MNKRCSGCGTIIPRSSGTSWIFCGPECVWYVRDKELGPAWAALNSNPWSQPKQFTVVPRHEPTISGHRISRISWNYVGWWKDGGFQNRMGMEPIEDEV